MTTTPENSSTPVIAGPITSSVNLVSASAAYPRKPDGSVDWRALVPAAMCYVKSDHKEAVAKLLNKPVAEIRDLSAEDLAKVPDRYLVVRKAGILELARLRGWTSATPQVKHVQRDYVVVQTWIDWAPFEGKPAQRSGGVGEACPENTTKLGAAYLAATAENRAFSRAVRQFLEIDIVCSDELGQQGVEPEQEASSTTSSSSSAGMDLSAQGSLTRAANEGGFTFDQVKKAAQSRWDEDTAAIAKAPATRRRIENDPAPWTTWKEIPPRDCLTLIQLIKAYKAASGANVKAKEASKAAAAPAPTPAAIPAKKRTAPATAKVAPTIPVSQEQIAA